LAHHQLWNPSVTGSPLWFGLFAISWVLGIEILITDYLKSILRKRNKQVHEYVHAETQGIKTLEKTWLTREIMIWL